MQRLSIHQFCSLRWSLFQDVVKYSNLGFHSIGLWRAKVSDFGFEEAAELLDEMNMSVSSLNWAGGFTGSEGNSFKLSIEDGLEAIYQAHMVGAEHLIVHPGGRNGHTESHALRLLRSALAELVPAAKDLGVQLLLEPVENKKNPWNFITDVDCYIDLLADYSPCEVGMVLDLFQIGKNRRFTDNFAKYSDRISLVQLSDGRFHHGEYVRCELGDGLVPLETWLNLLTGNGYDGKYEIELHGREFENQDYAEVIKTSQEFFANSTSKLLSGILSN